MKSKQDVSKIIQQVNDLLLTCNVILGENVLMDANAEKTHGLHLSKKQFAKGSFYAVKYKDTENGKWFDSVRNTGYTDYEKSLLYAIANKEKIINEIKEKMNKRKKEIDERFFYKMLDNYYRKDSIYLADDSVNNKSDLDAELRRQNIGNLKNYIIPFLKEKEIKGIDKITREVYSELKIYLQNQTSKTTNKKLSVKTINNILQTLIRILDYHFRNEKITKLPYIKGTALFPKNDTNENQAGLLPTKLLNGLITNYIIDIGRGEEVISLENILWIIGLTTGLRDSEIARIKRGDIQPLPESQTFILKAWNKKTDKHNKVAEEKYRKIPLNNEVVKVLKLFVSNKELENKKDLEKESLTRENDIIKLKEKIKKLTETKNRYTDTLKNYDSLDRKKEIEKRIKSLGNSLFYAEKKLAKLETETKHFEILPDDYIFGESKIDNDTGEIDGFLHPRHFRKSIDKLYEKIFFKKYLLEANFEKAYNLDEKEIKKEMIDNKIKFYSLRHTHQTLMALYKNSDTNIDRDDSLLDYFAGHKSGKSVRDNYIHINKGNL